MGKAKGFKLKSTLKASEILMRCAPVGVLTACVGLSGSAQAQTAEEIKVGTAPEVAVGALSGDLTASKYIKDPGAPYENFFRDADLGLSATPKVGPTRSKIGFGSVNLADGVGTPVDRGARPESAELKIGNFYLDILSVTASMLYTDNENLSDNNRQDDFATALSLRLRALYQLNDGLRVGVQGSLIWLPSDGRAGVDGFGISDPYARLSLDDGHLFNTYVASDFTLGRWDVTVYDQFHIVNRTLYNLGDSGSLDFYDGERFSETDNFRGRRLFKPGGNTGGTYVDRTRNTGRFQADALDYVNTVGIEGNRVLPTDLKAIIGYYHQNYWYSSASRALRLTTRAYNYKDVFYAHLESQRENLRFKPYAYYRLYKNDLELGWNQAFGGGVIGPITDQLLFQGEVGYVYSGNGRHDTETWGVALLHEAGPYTRQSIEYRRYLTDPEDLVEQALTYRLQQVIGPYLTGYFYARYTKYEDLNTAFSDSEEELYGVGLQHDLGKFGTIQFIGLRRTQRFDNPRSNDYTSYTLRVVYDFPLGETVDGSVFYQYENRDSKAVGDDYYENLAGLRLTKRF